MLNPSRHQVLIVDDDDAVRDSLSLLLKASGFEVSTAADGLEVPCSIEKRVFPPSSSLT